MNDFITIITDNDLDGAMCALLVELAHPNNTVLKYFSGKKSDELVNIVINNGTVNLMEHFYIADVNIDIMTADRINRYILPNGKHLKDITTFKDHHEESLPLCRLDFKEWAEVDIETNETKIYNECGASLLFKYLDNTIQSIYSNRQYTSIKRMVEAVTYYDTWKWFQNESTDILPLYYNILLNILGLEKFVEIFKYNIFKCDRTADEVFGDYHQKVQGAHEIIKLKIDKYIELAKREPNQYYINEYKVCALYCDSYISEIGNYICKYTDIDICALFNYEKIALRTNNPKIDLITPATKLGGGGRGMSANFPIKDLSQFIELKQFIISSFNNDTSNEKLHFKVINGVHNGLEQGETFTEPKIFETIIQPDESRNAKDDLSSAIDDLDIQGTDTSDVTTKNLVPEVNWEEESRKAEEIKAQEYAEQLANNPLLDEDLKDIEPVEIEESEPEFIVPKPKVNVPNKNRNNNGNNKKRKKPNIKPQNY